MENLIDTVVQYINFKILLVLILFLKEKDIFISKKKTIVVIVVTLLMDVDYWDLIGKLTQNFKDYAMKMVPLIMFGTKKDYRVICTGRMNRVDTCLELINNQMILKHLMFKVSLLILMIQFLIYLMNAMKKRHVHFFQFVLH